MWQTELLFDWSGVEYKTWSHFATALCVSRATKVTNTPGIASARHELVRKDLARPIYVICSLDMRLSVHSLPACYVFHNSNCYFLFFYAWTVRRLCVTGTNVGQRKHNEFRVCVLLVSSVRLALVWRSSGVYIYTWKNAHIFEHAENVRRGRRTQEINNVHPAFSSNHQRILTHTQRNTTHCPKFFIFCTLDVRDGMCDWALSTNHNFSRAFFLPVHKTMVLGIARHKFELVQISIIQVCTQAAMTLHCSLIRKSHSFKLIKVIVQIKSDILVGIYITLFTVYNFARKMDHVLLHDRSWMTSCSVGWLSGLVLVVRF